MRGFGMWGKFDEKRNQSPSIVVSPSPPYDCTYDRYDCDDFADRAQAQDAYEACGGTENDIHSLDQDKDGIFYTDLAKMEEVTQIFLTLI